MNLSFRKATGDDVELINELAQKIWHEHYPAIIAMEQIEFMLLNRYSLKVIADWNFDFNFVRLFEFPIM